MLRTQHVCRFRLILWLRYRLSREQCGLVRVGIRDESISDRPQDFRDRWRVLRPGGHIYSNGLIHGFLQRLDDLEHIVRWLNRFQLILWLRYKLSSTE